MINYLYRNRLAALSNPQTPLVCARGQETRELIGASLVIPMLHPIITIPERKVNYKFMLTEAAWILSGRQDLFMLLPACKEMGKFSDDGMNLSGAYGPKFISQARYVADAILHDSETRQAVMTLWERNPRQSKDIPCTVAMQWLLRDKQLHLVVFMRSSDIWLGIPYDIFSFTMMTHYIRLLLLQRGITAFMGDLHLTAGSQHLYLRDRDRACAVSESNPKDDGRLFDLDLYQLNTPGDLLEVLGLTMNVPSNDVLKLLEEICHSK